MLDIGKNTGKNTAKNTAKNYEKFTQYLAELVEKYGQDALLETEGANELEARYSTEYGR